MRVMPRVHAEMSAPIASHPFPPNSRVLREPPGHYSELGEQSGEEHRLWRERFIAQMQGVPGTAASGGEVAAVDRVSEVLLEITRLLAGTYGTPDLGNKADPVDELVYIILSRRTREGAYQAAYNALKTRYPTWECLASTPAPEIEAAISFSGLGRRKAQSLRLALGALLDRFGSCTLQPTRLWDDETTREFLCTLPEIGPKSAACVMVCSLDRPAFPVDAHVGRVLERLGTFREVGIELTGADHKAKQRLLWDAVPPTLRYPLHVNLLVHGRAVCLPRRPRCGSCALLKHCAEGHRRLASPSPGSSRLPE